MSSDKPRASPASPPPNPPPSRGRAERRVALAAVAGAHGIKGEIRLKLFGSLEGLAAQSQVRIGGRDYALRAVRAAGKGAIASLEGVPDRSAAEILRGALVEVDRSALPPLDEGEYYYADLIGLTCFSEDGETVGSVVGVENFGAGDLLDIEKVDGKRALIPFKPGIADLVEARIVLDPAFLA